MTLIITALSEDAIVQASDRRLTKPDGSLFNDNSNKAVCVVCADACFSVAYTGLAIIDRKPTDKLIVDWLTNIKAWEKTFPEIVDTLKNRFTAKLCPLKSLGRARGISLVFAGFGPRGPFAASLSNIEDDAGQVIRNVDDRFYFRLWFRNSKPLRKVDFLIHGREDAICATTETLIEKVRKRYLKKTPLERAAALVCIIREAAKHKIFGDYIGKECMSVIVQKNYFITEYYPSSSEGIEYCPHIVGPAGVFTDIVISTDPIVKKAKGSGLEKGIIK